MSKFRFQPGDDGLLSIGEAVGQALGAASTCWTDPGVFDTTRCKEIAESLLEFISVAMRILETPPPPSATTRELLTELRERGSALRDVDGAILAGYADQMLQTLDQRTLQ